MKKKICIIDDHEIIRTGIRKVINKTQKFKVTFEFASNKQLLNQPLKESFDLIIQDLELQNGCDLSQLELLNYKCPDVPILIYTMHPESMYGLACLKYNISGYLTKDKSVAELLYAIETICNGKRYFSNEFNEILTNNFLSGKKTSISDLSQREHEVFILIGEGLTLSDISKKLFIKPKTVSTYRQRILEKLNLSSTNQIIYHYLSNKIGANSSY